MSGIIVVLVSCQEDNPAVVTVSEPSFSSFSCKDKSGLLSRPCVIKNDTISVVFSEIDTSWCVPVFEGDFDYVNCDGERILSGKSVVDFNMVRRFECIKDSGDGLLSHTYTVIVKTLNGIPRVDIHTENAMPIESRDNYVNAFISISNDPEYGVVEGGAKIRGRGNCTWTDYPKKPYKIKFDEKYSIHGFPANKDWVLLAEYTDRSMVRTAFMAEISKVVGLPYTINYEYVDVFLNDEYKGLYLLADQVEKAKNRVDITSDGYLIEDDGYYMNEPLYFTSALCKYNYTFKYPKDLSTEDERFVWINDFINKIEDSLMSNPETDKYKEFKNYIDIESFVRWYIVEELLGNYDCNVFYTLNDRNSKLQMGPVWDAEWSLGLAYRKDGYWMSPSYGSPVEIDIWSHRKYFERLFLDEEFNEKLKNKWNTVYSSLINLPERIDEVARKLTLSQDDNFSVWPILGKFVRVEVIVHDTWDEEVEYVKGFYNQRLNYINTVINAL